MSQFSPAMDFLLNFEDAPRSYAETVDNNGGKVIAGINSKFFPSQESAIASVAPSQRPQPVAQFYYVNFWMPLQAGGINDQDVANRLLSCGVNCGMGTAVRLLQQAVNAIHPGTVAQDGLIGPLTLEAVNATDPDALLASFRQEQANHYNELVAENPSLAPSLPVWLARAQA